jgi:RNA-directed DNA polymerase
MPASAIISVLARSFLAGDPNEQGIVARAQVTLGRPWRWLRPLARRYMEFSGGRPRPRHRDVVEFLLHDERFRQARAKYRDEIYVAQWIGEPQRMQPVQAAAQWDLPVIESTGALADWLSLSPDELGWFADRKGLGNKLHKSKLQHYRYQITLKRSGGVRLIESPKPRLKELQRRILVGILDRIPPHPAAHGFVKGRSIVSFARPHTGKAVLLRLDLQDFFPTFPAARVQAFFRTIGYPEPVADRLGGLCTNAVSREVWNGHPVDVDYETRILYARPHLPQGAPTSPALANITTYRLDCRLSGLARSAGAQYTRYADDLAFSGSAEFHRVVQRFQAHAAAIALEEGFHVNHRKTRILRPGVRQHLAGIVVNRNVSLARRDLELLEAILTNCARSGPESQNRASIPNFRAHLEGRVGFVEMVDRAKGSRLRELFDAVRWP